MSREDLEGRRGLTFAQAEGAAPLPQQHKKREIPVRLRSKLWDAVSILLDNLTGYEEGQYGLAKNWYNAIKYYYVDNTGHFGDNFVDSDEPEKIKFYVKGIFKGGSYIHLFDLLQRLLEANQEFHDMPDVFNSILASELSAYRIYDRTIIAPITSEVDATTITKALEQTERAGATGSRSHLRKAIQLLNASRFSDSVRESINAVESVAKVLSSDPKTELAGALATLEKSSNIHGGMKRAFNALYGYTSDENGIRHSLLYGSEAKVDEADALFMIGACSAFITYLINRARDAGIPVASAE